MPTTKIVGAYRFGVVALLLLSGALSSCSLMKQPWPKTEVFVAGLQCNISEAQLRHYSARFPQVEIWDPDQSDGLVVSRKGNTKILLWFEANGLTSYQITWTYPVTNFDSKFKTDLCSGVQYVDLSLVGDSELSGATVWLDGESVGKLSSSGTFSWDVPLGAHHIHVETAEGASWSTELRYDETSSGRDRVPLPKSNLSRSRAPD